jgi:putative acetyltransferase
VKVAYFEDLQPSPSVWATAADLRTHVRSLGKRTRPFGRHPSDPGRTGVAWWVADRHDPTVDEAHARLQFLTEHGPSPYAFPALEPQPQLSIDRVWLDDADVQLLIAQLNMDLYSRYPEPGALVFSLDPADIVDGVGALLMAVLAGRPVGCGAFRMIDDQPGSAEIKRMYVALAGRGKKLGAALLVELERRAIALGTRRFFLETGPRQPEALHRYEQAGYVRCEPWSDFGGTEFSICMSRVVHSAG